MNKNSTIVPIKKNLKEIIKSEMTVNEMAEKIHYHPTSLYMGFRNGYMSPLLVMRISMVLNVPIANLIRADEFDAFKE